MRATIETHENDDELPPIKIIISDGDNNADVIIKISDEGGGIKRKNINRIWDYFYTTSKIQVFDKDGKEAITHFKVLGRYKNLSLIHI